eukprot:1175526-Prorocentrum_minimum.AAC.1
MPAHSATRCTRNALTVVAWVSCCGAGNAHLRRSGGLAGLDRVCVEGRAAVPQDEGGDAGGAEGRSPPHRRGLAAVGEGEVPGIGCCEEGIRRWERRHGEAGRVLRSKQRLLLGHAGVLAGRLLQHGVAVLVTWQPSWHPRWRALPTWYGGVSCVA